jgi:hypothetical protein
MLSNKIKNMKKIVSTRTARKLEAAGFERPMPEIGQFWYTPNGRLYHIVGVSGSDIFVKWHNGESWSSQIVFYDSEYDDWFYAATATDILHQLGCNFVLWYDKSPKLQMWYCAETSDIIRDTKAPYGNENAAEAVAEAYLSQSKQ